MMMLVRLVISLGAPPKRIAKSSKPQMSKLAEQVTSSTWGQTGKQILVGKYKFGDGVALLDIETNQLTTLTTTGKDPSISPDGNQFVFVRGVDDLFLYNLETNAELSLGKGYFPSWSNDGSWLYFGGRTKERESVILKMDTRDFDEPALTRGEATAAGGEILAHLAAVEVIGEQTGQGGQLDVDL